MHRIFSLLLRIFEKKFFFEYIQWSRFLERINILFQRLSAKQNRWGWILVLYADQGLSWSLYQWDMFWQLPWSSPKRKTASIMPSVNIFRIKEYVSFTKLHHYLIFVLNDKKSFKVIWHSNLPSPILSIFFDDVQKIIQESWFFSSLYYLASSFVPLSLLKSLRFLYQVSSFTI